MQVLRLVVMFNKKLELFLENKKKINKKIESFALLKRFPISKYK